MTDSEKDWLARLEDRIARLEEQLDALGNCLTVARKPRTRATKKPKKEVNPDRGEAIAYWVDAWMARHPNVADRPVNSAQAGQLSRAFDQLAQGRLDDWRSAVDGYMADDYASRQYHPTGLFVSQFLRWKIEGMPAAGPAKPSVSQVRQMLYGEGTCEPTSAPKPNETSGAVPETKSPSLFGPAESS